MCIFFSRSTLCRGGNRRFAHSSSSVVVEDNLLFCNLRDIIIPLKSWCFRSNRVINYRKWSLMNLTLSNIIFTLHVASVYYLLPLMPVCLCSLTIFSFPSLFPCTSSRTTPTTGRTAHVTLYRNNIRNILHGAVRPVLIGTRLEDGIGYSKNDGKVFFWFMAGIFVVFRLNGN